MNAQHPPSEPVPSLSPEIALLLRCTRWPQTSADRKTIRDLSSTPLDWQLFLLLAQHHRLVPLVAHNLQAALTDQPPILHELQQLAAANTYRTLRSLAELKRLVLELETRGVAVRVLKGIPLAQTVFGNLNLRAVGDLDLLIDESSILQTDEVLRGFGYVGLFPIERLSPRRLAFYRAHWKDLAYTNPATGFEVDLHWRCFRNPAMPGNALCDNPARETVPFGNFQVSTLPRMETLLYLCVHGTLDGWLYLKSLADVAAQVRDLSAADLDILAALAATYGILPELSAALILVRRYLALDHWSAALLPATEPTVAHILRFADKALLGGGFLANRDAISPSAMMAFEFGLRLSLRYRMELLVRVLFRARMWQTIPLPDILFPLYPLLSPVEWILFRVRLWRKKPLSL